MNVKVLELQLTCDEEATYQQGTDIRTERHQLHSTRLFIAKRFEIEPSAPFETTVDLQIPGGAMHSFQSRHNAVIWRLVVRGVAENWPPFERSFPLIVYPSPPDVSRSTGANHRRGVRPTAGPPQPQNLHTPE